MSGSLTVGRRAARQEQELAGRPGSSLSLDALAADCGSVSSLRLSADGAAGRGCERCASSDGQLQQAQAELRAAEKRRSELSRALERHQQDLSREARYRKQTEQQWQQLAEQSQRQVSARADASLPADQWRSLPSDQSPVLRVSQLASGGLSLQTSPQSCVSPS